MRVTSYTETGADTHASVLVLSILLCTILLGLGVVPTVADYFGGPLPRLMTPLWLLLYLGSFLCLMFRHGINWITWMVRYRLLLVLLLIGTILSVTWSINPQLSAERVVHLVGSSLVAVFISFTIPLLVILRTFAVVLALCLFASVAAAVGLPQLGIEAYEGTQVWKGVFNSKNDLGFWAGVGVLLYVTLSDSSPTVTAKLLCWMMVVVSLGLLALSHSATSLVAMLVAGSLALYLYIANRFQLSFFRMAFIALLFVALIGLITTNIETSELVGRSGDLTGRGEVWTQVIRLIFDFPLKGVGYGSLWFPTEESISAQKRFFDFTWVVYHAHNGLLQIASEVGIPLALVALLMVTQQLIEIFYCQYERRQVGVLFVLSFVVAFLVSNYSEARFLVSRELFWIFFLALPISMLRQINERSTDLPNDRTAYAGLENGWRGNGPQPGTYGPGDTNSAMPWLEPLATQNSAQNPASAPAKTPAPASALLAGPASLVVKPELDKDNDRNDYPDALDLTSSVLSLTEADIDLGGLVEETTPEKPRIDTSGHTGDDAYGVVSGEPQLPKTTARNPDTFDNNDSFDIDRYDIDFDFSGDWTNTDVDIDLDDNQ